VRGGGSHSWGDKICQSQPFTAIKVRSAQRLCKCGALSVVEA